MRSMRFDGNAVCSFTGQSAYISSERKFKRIDHTAFASSVWPTNRVGLFSEVQVQAPNTPELLYKKTLDLDHRDSSVRRAAFSLSALYWPYASQLSICFIATGLIFVSARRREIKSSKTAWTALLVVLSACFFMLPSCSFRRLRAGGLAASFVTSLLGYRNGSSACPVAFSRSHVQVWVPRQLQADRVKARMWGCGLKAQDISVCQMIRDCRQVLLKAFRVAELEVLSARELGYGLRCVVTQAGSGCDDGHFGQSQRRGKLSETVVSLDRLVTSSVRICVDIL